MIKHLSGEMEKNRENDYIKIKQGYNYNPKDHRKTVSTDRPLVDLAKSSFYLSLSRHYQKRILSFTELVQISAKQHFKGKLGKSVFGSSFK